VIGELNLSWISHMMSAKRIFTNLSVVIVSAALGLLLCELASRLILHPADYLEVQMVKDEALGAVPSASSRSGLDKWGYRNPGVPASADIVAVGDSHTFGNDATMDDSWPYVLRRLSGRSVYNLGMGGYGPNQYFYLLRNKALKLNPKLILCGFYMGDDFDGAYLMTYGSDYWSYLRALPGVKVDLNTWDIDGHEVNPGLVRRTRMWLARHSVIYQIAFHASSLGNFQGDVRIENAHSISPLATSLIIPEKRIKEAFLPEGILRRLDQNSPSVREGMRISFDLLTAMNELSKQNHSRFVVVIIPAKEMVFGDYFKAHPEIPLSDVLNRTVTNGLLAEQKLITFLTDSHIPYVDTLPALRASVENELYARSITDMHPAKNGYLVIGEAVFAALKQGEASVSLHDASEDARGH
jgi:hypothetical protein